MKAFVSIAGPEYPEMRYSICGFLMPGNVLEAVALEVERLFGYSVVAIGPKSSANRNWRLSPGGAMAEMPCERVIALESYAPQTETTLGFLDLHLPNTGHRQVGRMGQVQALLNPTDDAMNRG
jgi:hypothetical protein